MTMHDLGGEAVYPKTTTWLNGQLGTIAPYRAAASVLRIKEKGPAAGWYHPLTGDIGISYKGALEDLHLTDEQLIDEIALAWRKENGHRILGLVVHETAHSAWSGWLTDFRMAKGYGASQWVGEILTWAEEIRIETSAMEMLAGRCRANLRAMFKELVLNTMADVPLTSKYAASMAWALAVGRAYSTVCDHDEVQAIEDVCRTAIGDAEVDELHEILSQLVVLDLTVRTGVDRAIELANQWLEITGEPEPDSFTSMTDGEDGDEAADGEGEGSGAGGEGEGEGESDSADGEGEDGEDDADGGGATVGSGEAKVDADDSKIQDPSAGVGMGSYGATETNVTNRDEMDNTGWKPVTGDAAKAMLDTISKARDRVKIDEPAKSAGIRMADEQDMARKVFGHKNIRNPRVYRARPATGDERRAVAQLAQHLEQMNFTLPYITEVPSLVPPGRLNTRAAVQVTAERARGGMVTAKPWQAKRRKHVHNPPITLGLMTDVSGSMRWAEDLVAATSYIFSNAMSRVSGRFAAVTFGNQAECVVRPNERLDEVFARPANGSCEQFDQGIAALNGVLHLTSAKGIRVLVVVSDGHFVEHQEPERREIWAKRLAEAGVALVWLDNSTRSATIPKTAEVVRISGSADITTFINPIAKAIDAGIAKSLAG